MRLLIVKLSSFGDIVHTLPPVTDIHAARPDIEIDWLVEEDLAPIARRHPAVGNVYGIAFRKLRWPPTNWPALLKALRGLRRTLKARNYDLVIDFQGLIKSAVMANFAGAPVVGFAEPREVQARYLYKRTCTVDTNAHAVERSRQLAAAALGYDLPAGLGSYGIAPEAGESGLGLPPGYGIFLHGASWQSKCWPEARWRELAEFAVARGETVVLPWGSDDEHARARRIADGLDGVIAMPRRLATEELPDLLGRAGWVVGLDSGLTHYAAALGRAAIWLYGPTDPGRTGPYGENQEIIASADPNAPCRRRHCEGHDCMGGIDVERVEAALAERLRRGQAAG